jgi:hypothetical protein
VPKTTAQILEIERVTKANARQRAGRTGRLRAGTVMRLYPEKLLASLPEHAPYEFELIPPYAHVLKLLGAGLDARILLGFGPVPEQSVASLPSSQSQQSKHVAGASDETKTQSGGLSAEEMWIRSQFQTGGAPAKTAVAVSNEAIGRTASSAFYDDDDDDDEDGGRIFKRARVDAGVSRHSKRGLVRCFTTHTLTRTHTHTHTHTRRRARRGTALCAVATLYTPCTHRGESRYL